MALFIETEIDGSESSKKACKTNNSVVVTLFLIFEIISTISSFELLTLLP